MVKDELVPEEVRKLVGQQALIRLQRESCCYDQAMMDIGHDVHGCGGGGTHIIPIFLLSNFPYPVILGWDLPWFQEVLGSI